MRKSLVFNDLRGPSCGSRNRANYSFLQKNVVREVVVGVLGVEVGVVGVLGVEVGVVGVHSFVDFGLGFGLENGADVGAVLLVIRGGTERAVVVLAIISFHGSRVNYSLKNR